MSGGNKITGVHMNRPGYEEYRDRQAADARERSQAGREIGPLPAVADPVRRADCERNLRLFAETYFAERFSIAWSEDHLRMIARLESCVLDGGLFALAMARGSGKTTLVVVAVIWALLYGHRKFVMLLAGSGPLASVLLDSVRASLEGNDLLLADFPETCYPIRKLERIYNRCNGQRLDGRPTDMKWTKWSVVLPSVGDRAGGVLRAHGLTGSFRGAQHTSRLGVLRPDLVIADDPQTKTSARSPRQCDDREQLLKRDALGLGGPGVSIACVVPCTVIRHGDLAHRLLDRKANPDWQGETAKLLYTFPSDREKWAEYARLRAEDLAAGGAGEPATEYYRKNQAAMDLGAKVGWAERYNRDEISAVQHCMNLHLKDPGGFAAEYCNEPAEDGLGAVSEQVTEAILTRQVTKVPRGAVPADCTRLTAYIDIQGKLLFWVVVGWTETFGGHLMDWGTTPDQRLPTYTAASASPTMADAFPVAADFSGQVYAALSATFARLLDRPWPRTAGGELRVSQILVDANWGKSNDTVHRVIRDTGRSAVVMAAHGKGLGAKDRPMSTWKITGERRGMDWRVSRVDAKTYVTYDTNSWKSFVAGRLLTAPGGHGALTIGDQSEWKYRLLWEHLTSEYAQRLESEGRVVDEWSLRPNRENHWWDGLVGCAVAASVLGLTWSPAAAAGGPLPAPPAPKKSMSERQREAWGRNG
jgi:hypothetical protein